MITAFVQFQFPQALNKDQARTAFLASAPQYRGVPGLLRKYYVLSDDGRCGGGIYLWQSREVAERFFTDDWRRVVTERFGAPPSIAYFLCPVVVDNVSNETLSD